MPKPKKPVSKRSGKKTKTSFLSNRRNQLIILFVVVVAAVAVYVPIYQKNQAIKAEKQDFLTKQVQLQDIASRISGVNKPDDQKVYQYCRYQSAKFEKGDLYCTVGVELMYMDLDVSDANRIKNDSKKYVGVAELRNPLKIGVTEFPEVWDEKASSFSQSLSLEKCNASYTYPYPLSSDKDLRIVLSCSSISKAEHFPLKK